MSGADQIGCEWVDLVCGGGADMRWVGEAEA